MLVYDFEYNIIIYNEWDYNNKFFMNKLPNSIKKPY